MNLPENTAHDPDGVIRLACFEAIPAGDPGGRLEKAKELYEWVVENRSLKPKAPNDGLRRSP